MLGFAPNYTPRVVAPEHLEGDLIDRGDPRHGVTWVNPARLGGTPCFFGTRVPIQHLFDYLEGGETLDDFLAGFPDVTREHAQAVLELARSRLMDGPSRR